jgi:hypothetical protein
MADRLMASPKFQDLKPALAESPRPPEPDHAQGQDVHPLKGFTQQDSPIVHRGAFQSCSRRQQSGPQIGTHAHQIPLGK